MGIWELQGVHKRKYFHAFNSLQNVLKAFQMFFRIFKVSVILAERSKNFVFLFEIFLKIKDSLAQNFHRFSKQNSSSIL